MALPREERNTTTTGVTTRSITPFSPRTTFVLVLMVINATVVHCRGNSSCPSNCQCFYALPNELDNPPTYTPVTSNQDGKYALLSVSCQRQQLTSIPKGIPTDTSVLFLAYNELDHLEKSMFEGLEDIRTFDASHNKISRIAKDTFNKMKKLQYLNIAYNDMTKIPHGFLCPWYYHNNIESTGVFGCEEKEAAKSVVGLNTIQNPWHCDCAFQEFIENFSCQIGKSPCIEFLKDLDNIGECHTPTRLGGTPILRLSARGAEGSRNMCRNKSHIDIPMVITMVSWFGGIIGYTIYFIRWNQKEIARQSSYLASLDKKPQSIADSRMGTHESQTATQGSQSEGDYVQTTGQSPDRHQKLRFEQKPIKRHLGMQRQAQHPTPSIWVERCISENEMDCDGEYPVSRQVDSHQESSSFRQKRRACVSSPSSPQNKVKQEEVYRMSSL